MKVAVVASLVTPLLPVQAGGAQAFLTDLARGLAGRGHSLLLYCADGSDVPGVDLVQIPVTAAVARALVMPGGAPAEPVPELRAAFEVLFAELRRRGADAVSQHAFDAEAIELAEGLPVLHTLHLPPLVPSVVAAARGTSGRLATVSHSSRREWAKAGVEATVLPDGVPDWQPEPRSGGSGSPDRRPHLAREGHRGWDRRRPAGGPGADRRRWRLRRRLPRTPEGG